MTQGLKKPRNYICQFKRDADEVYKPAGNPLRDLEQIIFPRDEIEAKFLCYSDNLTQEEAGKRVGV
jgi:predicted DNA-binding protein (UPF0251 family)